LNEVLVFHASSVVVLCRIGDGLVGRHNA
jgi:hypothetical protein